MKAHLTMVGLINLATGLFFIALAALTVLGVLAFAPAFSGAPLWKPADMGYVLVIVSLVGGVFLLIGVPSLITGIGLLKKKTWARLLAIITSLLIIAIPPLGTIAGLYSLWVLMQKETGQILAAT